MLAFSQVLSAFCLLHPSFHIIQSSKPFLALCFYAFHIYLAQLFFLSDLIFLLCTMLPKCSLSPYLNKISGSSSPPQKSLSCLLSTGKVRIVGIAIDLLFSFVSLPNPWVPCVCLTYLCGPRASTVHGAFCAANTLETFAGLTLLRWESGPRHLGSQLVACPLLPPHRL